MDGSGSFSAARWPRASPGRVSDTVDAASASRMLHCNNAPAAKKFHVRLASHPAPGSHGQAGAACCRPPSHRRRAAAVGFGMEEHEETKFGPRYVTPRHSVPGMRPSHVFLNAGIFETAPNGSEGVAGPSLRYATSCGSGSITGSLMKAAEQRCLTRPAFPPHPRRQEVTVSGTDRPDAQAGTRSPCPSPPGWCAGSRAAGTSASGGARPGATDPNAAAEAAGLGAQPLVLTATRLRTGRSAPVQEVRDAITGRGPPGAECGDPG